MFNRKKKIKLPTIYMAVKESDCQAMYFTKLESAYEYLNGEPGWVEVIDVNMN